MTIDRIERLAIVGAGAVASALSQAAASAGIPVEHWVRSPESADVPGGAAVVALDQVSRQRAVVILAVPFAVAGAVVAALPLEPGSVVVDVTNPFGRPVPQGHPSGAAWVSECAPAGVRIVKAFNVLGAESMTRPGRPGGAAVLPVASDDPVARQTVVSLAVQLGFDAVDVGGLAASGVLEEAARYWGLLAIGSGLGRDLVLVADRGDGDG